MALRIVFCGTPAFAVPALRHLLAQPDIEVAGVVTQPDRPRGRGREISTPPVKDAALEAGLSVFQPARIKSDPAREYFTQIAPDAVVIIAYGQIIPAHLIAIPRLGWINVHGSLLPKYRGAAPINWAIMNGETRTGLTTMQIDAGLDTGPMLLKYETDIGPNETAPELTSRLAEAGASLIVETLRKLDCGEIIPTPQDNSKATFAPPLKKAEGLIDWTLPTGQIYSRIRGLQPWPGAFTTFRGKICQIWGKPLSAEDAGNSPSKTHQEETPGTIQAKPSGIFVSCGSRDILRLEFLQLEGRNRVTAREFANGAHLAADERFGKS